MRFCGAKDRAMQVPCMCVCVREHIKWAHKFKLYCVDCVTYFVFFYFPSLFPFIYSFVYLWLFVLIHLFLLAATTVIVAPHISTGEIFIVCLCAFGLYIYIYFVFYNEQMWLVARGNEESNWVLCCCCCWAEKLYKSVLFCMHQRAATLFDALRLNAHRNSFMNDNDDTRPGRQARVHAPRSALKYWKSSLAEWQEGNRYFLTRCRVLTTETGWRWLMMIMVNYY